MHDEAHDRLAQATSSALLATCDAATTPGSEAEPADALALLAPRAPLTRRFRIERMLGAGATGAVFEAFDFDARQSVAVKVLNRREPESLLRLKREFRELVELAHPNLVGVHELFVPDAGHAFFTMDLVAGATSFVEHLRLPGRSACDPNRLYACLAQLVSGVEHLHGRGKLHRDLKPSNVLIDRDHRLRIVDFGLVAPLHGASYPNRFEGTPAYAAPEQLEGLPGKTASDWYAVGVMLFEVLTGRRPEAAGTQGDRSRSAPEAPMLLAAAALAGTGAPAALQKVTLALLERDPVRRASGRDLLAALGAGAPLAVEAAPAEPVSLPFVGRDRELEQLEDTFARMRSTGATGACLIEGPSGVGKTSLASRFVTELETNKRALVLRGRCFVLESVRFNALDGIVDALAQRIHADGAGLEQQLDVLGRLFPVLRGAERADASGPATLALDPHQVRRVAGGALRALLAHASDGRPIVLFVDDLQWADADSARLLEDLLGVGAPGVWLLGTYRRDALVSAPPAELARVLAGAERIELGPLSPAAVVELASRALTECPEPLAREIARQSSGDPLLVAELVRHAHRRGELPPLGEVGLEAALRSRLEGLSRPARSLLDVICTAGRRLPRAILLEGSSDPMASLRELRRAGTVRESHASDGTHLEASHDRIREIVLAGLPASRRRELHRTLAERLRAHGAAYLDQVAQHYARAGMPAEASAAAEAAARDAARGYAFHNAVELLELALRNQSEPSERQRLRIAAALACARAGRCLAAANHYEAAANDATAPAQQTELRLQALTAYLVSGHGRKGRELLGRSAADLGLALEFGPMRLLPGLWWMTRLLLTGGPKLREARQRPALRRRGGVRPRADAMARERTAVQRLWRCAPALMVVEPELACQFAVRAMFAAAEQGDASTYAQSLSFQLAAFVLVLGRTPPLLHRRFEHAERLALRDDDIWGARLVQVMRASAAMLVADHEQAIERCMAVAQATELGNTFAISVRGSARALVIPSLYLLGRLEELAGCLEPWLEEAIDAGDRHLQITCRVLGAHRHLRHDDVTRARRELEAAKAVEVDYHHPALTDPWWAVQVELFDGRPERAREIYERALPHMPSYVRYSTPLRLLWTMADAQSAAAMAARGLDRRANLDRLDRALRVARRLRGPAAAHAAAQIGAMSARLRGKPDVAAQQLTAAMTAYRACSMRLHAAIMQLALCRIAPRGAEADEQAARAVFRAEGIRSPERWARAVLPGFWDEG